MLFIIMWDKYVRARISSLCHYNKYFCNKEIYQPMTTRKHFVPSESVGNCRIKLFKSGPADFPINKHWNSVSK